jgi:photosystem II stability/assembly factor-like uncharacterized protein
MNFTQIRKERRNRTSPFALCLFLLAVLISLSLTACGGGGGGGGGAVGVSGGSINTALFSGWEMTNGPFSGTISSLAVDPNKSQKIYAGVEIGGLFTSDDGGRSWTHIGGKLEDLCISSVALANNGRSIYVGTRGDGIFKTTDGGMSWSKVSNGLPEDPQTQDYFGVDNLYIDPQDSGIVYAELAWSYYLYRTTNGGNKWERIGLDLPFEPIMSLAIHPDNTQVLYAGTYSTGVWKSTDRGDSWNEINGNLPAFVVHFPCLAIDPDNNILYAGSRDYGLYKTLNDGTTWEFIKVGPHTVNENWDACVLAMDPIDKSTLYTYVETVSPAQPADDGVYRTFDGGNNWEKVPFHEYPNTYRPVREIAVAPSDGTVVYVTTQGYGLFMTGDAMSIDEVGDWASVDKGLVDLLVLTILLHPTDNKILCAGTEEGFYKTTDGGLTWERKGLKDKTVFALVSDPNNPNIIYAATEKGVYKTTNGGNSWHAPSTA